MTYRQLRCLLSLLAFVALATYGLLVPLVRAIPLGQLVGS